jgi:hypothetical protein
MILFSTILFYFSIVGIVSLFLLKSIEQKTGKSIIPENLILAIERIALRFFLKVAQLRSRVTKESLARMAEPVRHRAALLLLDGQKKFNIYFSKVVDMVRGKGTLIKRGRSSNFLNNIAEYKNLDKNEGSHQYL